VRTDFGVKNDELLGKVVTFGKKTKAKHEIVLQSVRQSQKIANRANKSVKQRRKTESKASHAAFGRWGCRATAAALRLPRYGCRATAAAWLARRP